MEDIITVVGTLTQTLKITEKGSLALNFARKIYNNPKNEKVCFVNTVLSFYPSTTEEVKANVKKYYKSLEIGDLLMFQLRVIEVSPKTDEKEARIFGFLEMGKVLMLRRKNPKVFVKDEIISGAIKKVKENTKVEKNVQEDVDFF